MSVEVTHNPGSTMGEFTIERDGERVARMNYSRNGQRVEILHTEVSPSLRGEGAGGKLVQAAVDWARAEGVQIVPLCGFAKAVFAKTAHYSDVLQER